MRNSLWKVCCRYVCVCYNIWFWNSNKWFTKPVEGLSFNFYSKNFYRNFQIIPIYNCSSLCFQSHLDQQEIFKKVKLLWSCRWPYKQVTIFLVFEQCNQTEIYAFLKLSSVSYITDFMRVQGIQATERACTWQTSSFLALKAEFVFLNLF